MPVEVIGEFGTPGAEQEWIVADCELAIKHLKKVCGEPPPEMELEIEWQEHELGSYPTIVLMWDDPNIAVQPPAHSAVLLPAACEQGAPNSSAYPASVGTIEKTRPAGQRYLTHSVWLEDYSIHWSASKS
jgi:hypothetical protein